MFPRNWKRCSRSATGSRCWRAGGFLGECGRARRACARCGGLAADRALDVRARGMTERVSARPIAAMRTSLRLRPQFGLAGRIGLAVALSLLCAAALIALSGHHPLTAFAAMASGAVGSRHQIGIALNRTTPYLISGAGVAMC